MDMQRGGRDKRSDTLERIGYGPPAPYTLDIEVVAMRELRKRAPAADLHRPHRIEFHELICVTRGSCTHVVDFEPAHCGPGGVLVLQPSQVEQFDVTAPWDGWLVFFRPEQLFAAARETTAGPGLVEAVAELPVQINPGRAEARLLRNAIAQMHTDARQHLASPEVQALLLHQLCALLWRLVLAHRGQHQGLAAGQPQRDRFRRFRRLLERSFASWHTVAPYADALGCTERTLTRLALGAAGLSAKTMIAGRITLEAKRLLAHTTLPVSTIGDQLGFDDASNFTKFFRREAGCTPVEFRSGYR
jgi:AraC-like DNA-binding protein